MALSALKSKLHVKLDAKSCYIPGSFATRCLHFEPLGFEVGGCLESIALADISVLVDDSIGPLELSLL